MDPRIGWLPAELISNAYSTWSNVWMIAQMNCTNNNVNTIHNSITTPLFNNPHQHSNLHTNNHVNSSRQTNQQSKLNPCTNSSVDLVCLNEHKNDNKRNHQNIHSKSLSESTAANLNHFECHNPNSSVTTQTIMNGLKSRSVNKASTFGFNFPINQDSLLDPMSTPWMSYLNRNVANSMFALAPLVSTKSKIKQHANSNIFDELSSTCSSASSIPSSPSNNDDSINLSNTTFNDEESNEILINTNSTYNNMLLTNNLNHFTLEQNNINSKNYYSDGLVTLHKEILAFSEYIAPTFEELYMRNEIICRITKVIKEQLPQAEVDVFGSYKTGLFLPTSDIDMVVFGEWKTLPLNFLKDALIREQISDQDNVKVLDRASVPIIKVLEPRTELKVDISFNTVNGVKSAELIKKYLVEFPCLRALVMVLKQFLIQRDFNEVWTGGIGSYSLILMTVSFLQLHAKVDPRSHQVNLGALLIEFFELYGRCFNYMKTAIRIQNGGSYMPKDELLKQFGTSGYYRSSVLCIEDPLNPSNDIGKGSYGALKVKQAFEYAYFVLSYAVLPQNEFLLRNSNQSVLGRIIRITREVRDYRQFIKRSYEKKVNSVISLAKDMIYLQNQPVHQTNHANGENNAKYLDEMSLFNLNKYYENETRLGLNETANKSVTKSGENEKSLVSITNHPSLHNNTNENGRKFNGTSNKDNLGGFHYKENQENRQAQSHNGYHHGYNNYNQQKSGYQMQQQQQTANLSQQNRKKAASLRGFDAMNENYNNRKSKYAENQQNQRLIKNNNGNGQPNKNYYQNKPQRYNNNQNSYHSNNYSSQQAMGAQMSHQQAAQQTQQNGNELKMQSESSPNKNKPVKFFIEEEEINQSNQDEPEAKRILIGNNNNSNESLLLSPSKESKTLDIINELNNKIDSYDKKIASTNFLRALQSVSPISSPTSPTNLDGFRHSYSDEIRTVKDAYSKTFNAATGKEFLDKIFKESKANSSKNGMLKNLNGSGQLAQLFIPTNANEKILDSENSCNQCKLNKADCNCKAQILKNNIMLLNQIQQQSEQQKKIRSQSTSMNKELTDLLSVITNSNSGNISNILSSSATNSSQQKLHNQSFHSPPTHSSRPSLSPSLSHSAHQAKSFSSLLSAAGNAPSTSTVNTTANTTSRLNLVNT